MSTSELPVAQDVEPGRTDFVYGFAAAPDALFASCASGLYRSTDKGNTWGDISDPLRTVLHLQGHITVSNIALSPNFEYDLTMFASVGGIVLRSSDAGKRWAATGLASPEPLISAITVSPNFAADGVVVIGTDEDGVFRSADRGAHW